MEPPAPKVKQPDKQTDSQIGFHYANSILDKWSRLLRYAKGHIRRIKAWEQDLVFDDN